MKLGAGSRTNFFVLALMLVGCGTLVGNPEDEGSKNTSRVGDRNDQLITFRLADAPIDDAVSVFVAIGSVEIRRESGEWMAVPLIFDQEIDLLQYQNGASVAFARTGAVDTGAFTDTRVVISGASPPRIVLNDGRVKTLSFGASQPVVALNNSFSVEAGLPVDITLDFDLRKSLQTQGEGDSREYLLSPTVRMVQAGEFSEIVGTAPAGKVACVYLLEAVMDDDDSCKNAVNSTKIKDGKYTLPFMEKGSYKVRIFDKDGNIVDPENEGTAHDVVPVAYKSEEAAKSGNKKKDSDDDDDDDDKDKKKSDKDYDKDNKGKYKDRKDKD